MFNAIAFFRHLDAKIDAYNHERITGEKTVKASIQKTDGGKFALYGPTGYVGAYQRERDAKRGALRRGLTVVG